MITSLNPCTSGRLGHPRLGSFKPRNSVRHKRLHAGLPLDAVIVGYYEGDQLLYAAKVRNGFVPRLRREVWQKLKVLEIASCPFVNLPEKKRTQWALTREEMKTAFG
jgi:hypothetical protein